MKTKPHREEPGAEGDLDGLSRAPGLQPAQRQRPAPQTIPVEQRPSLTWMRKAQELRFALSSAGEFAHPRWLLIQR